MANSDIQIYPSIPARRVDRNGISVREDVLYSDPKGREKPKFRKRAEKSLDSVTEVLRRVLEPGETIFYIASAQVMPGAVAQFFGGGWHAYSLPRTMFIATDRRIIALRLRKKLASWNWNQGIQGVRWGDLSALKTGGLISRTLTLAFRNGGKRDYWRFESGDMKKLAQIFEAMKAQAVSETSAAGAMQSLCPKCLAALSPQHYKCASCGTEFKDEKTLWQRGLMIPGGASLYVGANGLGVLRGIFEALITLSIILSVIRLIGSAGNHDLQEQIVTQIVLECFVLFLDKCLAFYLALPQVRDFIPVD